MNKKSTLVRDFLYKDTLCGMDCLLHPALPLHEWAAASTGPVVVRVIFHGYGANYRDLSFFARHFENKPGSWMFLNGPYKVPLGGALYGRAWYPFSIREFETMPRAELLSKIEHMHPEGLDQSCKQVSEALAALFARADAPPRFVLGGFSQGAILSVHMALMHFAHLPLDGLALCSGTLICRTLWQKNLNRLKGVRVFLSHGKGDEVLDFELALKLKSLLEQKVLSVEFVPFEGGHELSPKVLKGLKEFF